MDLGPRLLGRPDRVVFRSMTAATLPEGASDAIARMAATEMRVAPVAQLAKVTPTLGRFLLKHGGAFLRLAGPIAAIFVHSRWHLRAVRNSDDVWTVIEEMRPWHDRLLEAAIADDWERRARDLPRTVSSGADAGPAPADASDLLRAKYFYFGRLLLSSPHIQARRDAGGHRKGSDRLRADTAPFLRRLAEYVEFMPTLLLTLSLDAVLPALSNTARSIVERAADEAIEELIAFALAIGGDLEPPSGVTLPEPMPVGRLIDEWKQVLKNRRQ
jgi:hypothetical protein